jgi:hypothetical protein
MCLVAERDDRDGGAKGLKSSGAYVAARTKKDLADFRRRSPSGRERIAAVSRTSLVNVSRIERFQFHRSLDETISPSELSYPHLIRLA